ncbi:MAG: SDR family NAD(P)-dependent oxidoreductase [Okeania sp. SIO2C2]|uniref:type I polyketide synthase n=1 Tax=Okeania sp. SIO2C2 TaxID=2607787 RepID=UPI0013B82867|nr:type I polyketide synthase [Okeania sp. SIO2C2]NEP88106.1 SDR family NAD(P)-dependent oxidoreductase [Okeania sp. SIO2C2]
MITTDIIDDSAIAIIGISGRFPKAKDIDIFWKNLQEGVESIEFFSEEELLKEGIDPTLLKKQNYVKAGTVISDIDLFDANFFNYNPREAEIIDPQQRLFLESAVEALEVAGYDSQTYSGAIGVYAGLSESSYARNNIYPHLENFEPGNAYQFLLGNSHDFLSTRVSYKLNLTGPSITVQTACSTSLVAVHLACQSLLSGECDMALAGGVSIHVPQKTGYLHQEGMILSPDGHCRSFDAKAKGTLAGSGLGILVLKRLEDAIADGDYIYAQIKGSAINNDGSSKVGYTAPSIEGQAGAISEAQSIADIDPETISYIEAHGTATPLGDPIEVAALTKVFRGSTEKKGFCAIGSLKTNMGHLDAAAGVAGLIKTVLALKHKKIPPSLNFETPNPTIDFANSPFYVNTTLSEWNTNGTPRRAGVSSFGIGGTNAHVVLEEAPILEQSSKSRNWQLLMLSAKTNSALETATTNLATHLKQHPEINLADVAYTLQVGRTAFEYRRMLVCQDIDDALKALSTPETQPVLTHYQQLTKRPVVFMFSGQGAQYVNMAQELYQTESTFSAQVDSCSELLIPHLGVDLRHILYPQPEEIETATLQLKQTGIAQSAIFVVSYALAILWQEWGVSPQATIGHSIGEYVAATLAGVFSLEDALALVAKRGKLMQQQPPGAMLAVSLSEQQCQSLLDERVSLAAINGLSQCVLSGPTEAIDTLQQHLLEQKVESRRLHTSHAFHSQMMEPVLERFIEYFQQISLHPPEIPYISNVTGTWITAEQATDPKYWAKHLRQPVRFAEGIQHFLRDSSQILLEAGPGRTLSSLAKRHPDKAEEHILLTSVRHPQEKRSDLNFLLNTLGQLWLAGVRVDWEGFYSHQKRYRIPLPTYPFERQSYWIADSRVPKQNVQPKPSIIQKKTDLADWFYIPSWKPSNIDNIEPVIPTTNLVFADEFGLGDQIVQQMERNGQNVITVKAGAEFRKVSDRLYKLNPEREDDYNALCQELRERNEIPKTILHLWSIAPQSKDRLEIEWVEKSQNLGFYSLLFFAKALGRQQINGELLLGVVTNNMQKVGEEALLNPEQATVIGPVLTIGQEYPNIICRSIDVVLPEPGTPDEEILIEQISSELAIEHSEKMVAYRTGDRWEQTFEPVRLELGEKTNLKLKPEGVYLITGGLGGIGLVLAEHLAKTVQAKLMLIGRSKFPPREEWSEWLASHDAQDSISQKIHKIQKLEALGSEVLNICTDVGNVQQMQDAIAQGIKRFGKLNGVIHAAGIVGEKSFQTIVKAAKTECEQQFQPKIKGTLVLAKTLEKLELDFCILMSSLSSVLGGLGFVAYSSANSFMDAFVHQHNQTSVVPWVSVNWDGWHVMEVTKQSKSVGSSLAELVILPEEGINVFQRILSTNALHRIVISTANLQDRINQWVKLKALKQSDRKKTTEPSSFHSRPKLATSYIAPRNQTEQTIAQIWQQILGIEQIGIQDDFFELGGDSLIAVQVIYKLRETLQIDLPLEAILNSGTIAKLFESIQATTSSQNIPDQKTPQARSSLLVELQAGSNNKEPLFLLHPVGGTAYIYRDLARYLDSDIPVYGIQALGLDGKTELPTSLEQMATEYIKVIRTIQPSGAYFLGGTSLGGTVAFEMAQQLHAEDEKVALLAMIDTPGPGHMGVKLEDEGAIAAYILNTLFELDKSLFSFNSFPESGNIEEQVMYALEQAKIANLVPNDFEIPQTRQIIRVFKANMEAMWNYKPHIYAGKIIFFRAQDRREKYDPIHPEYPWIELAASGIEIHPVTGTHLTMNYEPHVQTIAEKLKVYFEQNN